MKEFTKVAVYGSLRYGLGNHRVLGQEGTDSTFLGTTTTTGFDMYSLYAFPQLTPNPEATHPIVIEVYAVTEDTMRRLDRLEGYPSFYDRKQIETEFGTAWVYFIEEAGEHPVPEGDWVLHLKNRNSI